MFWSHTVILSLPLPYILPLTTPPLLKNENKISMRPWKWGGTGISKKEGLVALNHSLEFCLKLTYQYLLKI